MSFDAIISGILQSYYLFIIRHLQLADHTFNLSNHVLCNSLLTWKFWEIWSKMLISRNQKLIIKNFQFVDLVLEIKIFFGRDNTRYILLNGGGFREANWWWLIVWPFNNFMSSISEFNNHFYAYAKRHTWKMNCKKNWCMPKRTLESLNKKRNFYIQVTQDALLL